jgi:hypothetical protein
MAEKTSDTEKHAFDNHHVEGKEEFADDAAHDVRITGLTEAERKAIMFRVDRRLVLTLGFLYMVSLIDRTNLGAAAIAGYVINFLHFGVD